MQNPKPDTPPPAAPQDPASSTTEPGPCVNGCEALGWAEGGLCGECDWYRQRDAAIREKNNRKGAAAWVDLVASIGGEAELPKYTLETFNGFDKRTEDALEAAKLFHPSTSNLYLTGVPGCGKTHLAIAIAQKFFAQGKSISYFKSGPALARFFQMRDPDEEERRLNVVARADVLVMNELGIGRDTDFRLEKLHEILDAREMLGKRGMVVTSNLHPEDWEKRTQDSRLRSRFEGPTWRIVLAGDQDYRAIQRAKRVA